MRALITNDDGIDSTGLHALTRVAVVAGLQVTVAAPHAERSGSGAALSALGAGGQLLVENRALADLPWTDPHGPAHGRRIDLRLSSSQFRSTFPFRHTDQHGNPDEKTALGKARGGPLARAG